MVYIRVAGHDDDVATVPAQCIHFGAAGGQKLGHTETMCPVFAITGNGFGVSREKRNVYGHVHGELVGLDLGVI